MKKRMILFLFLLLTISLNTTHAWDSEAAKFYPLAIGNVWSYHKVPYGNTFCYPLPNVSDYNVTVIGDTVMPNGKKYFLLSSGFRERIDSNTMNVYRYMGSFELLIDTLLARKNDHFIGYRLDFFNNNCSVTDTFQFSFANLSWSCKEITLSANGTNEYTLAKGLGLLRTFKCFQTGYEDMLNGCIIDGIQYGNIVGKQEAGTEIPGSFSLYQNYPNPFNPNTSIKFSVPQKAFVTIRIYNILGEEIAKLVNEEFPQGIYETNWDGTNYPSGIFYYQLTVSNGQLTNYFETKKMVLIK